MRYILAACMAGVILLSNSLIAAQETFTDIKNRQILRVGFDAGYMPFEMINTKGEFVGFDIDIAYLMAESLGVKLELVNTAWDGIIPSLLTGKFDIAMGGMTVTPERQQKIDFTDPYLIIGQTALVRKGLENTFESSLDLNNSNYVIASKIGTTGDLAAKAYLNKARHVQFETTPDALLDVANGKADAFIYDLPSNAAFSSQRPETIFHLAKPFTDEPLAWGIRKKSSEFARWLNEFLHTIKSDDTYSKLYKKWFENDDWKSNIR